MKSFIYLLCVSLLFVFTACDNPGDSGDDYDDGYYDGGGNYGYNQIPDAPTNVNASG